MTTSNQSVHPVPRPDIPAPSESVSNRCGYLSVALGIIVWIGSLVAAGCLFSQLGYPSLAIGGAGSIVGLGLLLIGRSLITRVIQPILQPQLETIYDIAPVTLPENIPPGFDLPPTISVTAMHIHPYLTYLATLNPRIAITGWGFYSIDIDNLKRNIFEDMPKKIDNFNNLDLPIYLQPSPNHWTLVYIDRQSGRVEYYDSLANPTEKVKRTLNEIGERLGFDVVYKITQPIQLDVINCALWVLFFVEYRSIIDFNQLDVNRAQGMIKNYRQQVLKKVIEMETLLRKTIKQNDKEYLDYYKDQQLANDMFKQDSKKISYIESWKQLLSGQYHLSPGMSDPI